jgi:hypothetical protein
MSNRITLEEIEEQVDHLSLHERLKLIAYISGQLSHLTLETLAQADDKEGMKRERLVEVDTWLAECDQVAELWEGEFDSAADVRRIRDEG